MASSETTARIAVRIAWSAGALGWLALTTLSAYGGGARTAVKGVPKVGGGHEVERFVLMQTVHIQHPNMRHGDAMEFWMQPGQFVPVSEDAAGVYFQSTSGFRIFRGSMGQKNVHGGLYVSKTRQDRIIPYVGNAKELGEQLEMDITPLLLDVRQKLKVARTERK